MFFHLNHFFVSSYCLSFCVCFCRSGTMTTPSLKNMDFCRNVALVDYMCLVVLSVWLVAGWVWTGLSQCCGSQDTVQGSPVWLPGQLVSKGQSPGVSLAEGVLVVEVWGSPRWVPVGAMLMGQLEVDRCRLGISWVVTVLGRCKWNSQGLKGHRRGESTWTWS